MERESETLAFCSVFFFIPTSPDLLGSGFDGRTSAKMFSERYSIPQSSSQSKHQVILDNSRVFQTTSLPYSSRQCRSIRLFVVLVRLPRLAEVPASCPSLSVDLLVLQPVETLVELPNAARASPNVLSVRVFDVLLACVPPTPCSGVGSFEFRGMGSL